MAICMSRACCSTDQEKRETARSLSKMVYKRNGVGPRGGASSYETLLGTPSPGQLLNNRSKVSKFLDVPRVSPGTDHPLTLKPENPRNRIVELFFITIFDL